MFTALFGKTIKVAFFNKKKEFSDAKEKSFVGLITDVLKQLLHYCYYFHLTES